MDFVFGNLPKNIDKNDIRDLTKVYKPSGIKFFKNTHIEHSSYECVVSLDISGSVAGNTIEKHLNNYCFNGSRISFHRLLF